MWSVHPVDMVDLEPSAVSCAEASESRLQGVKKFYPLGRTVMSLLGSLKGLSFIKGKNPEADLSKNFDEDLTNDETGFDVDKGYVIIREKFKLNKDDENQKDKNEEGAVFDLRVTAAHEVRRGNFSIAAEWFPVPVQKAPSFVLLRPAGPFNQTFLGVSEKGIPEMRPLNPKDKRPALFQKRDYIINSDYGSTFTNHLWQRQLSVSKDLHVKLDKVDGDPKSSTDPRLFLLSNTGTIHIRPAVAPDKYLGYESNRVVITDKISPFVIFPVQTVDHPTEDLEVALTGINNTSNSSDLHIGSSGLHLEPTSSGNSSADIDYYISRNGAWPNNRVVDAVVLRHRAMSRSWSQ